MDSKEKDVYPLNMLVENIEKCQVNFSSFLRLYKDLRYRTIEVISPVQFYKNPKYLRLHPNIPIVLKLKNAVKTSTVSIKWENLLDIVD